jgi:hypothetical protein
MNDRRETLLSVQEIVEKAIEEGATTVEQVHRSIASMPFDILEKVEALQKPVGKAREIHDQSVGNIYETIRLLNERAGEIARTLLKGKDA